MGNAQETTQTGQRSPLLALVGPTGVGKTDVAVELCLGLGGEIIGADSVQVYRGFDVGSGKPDARELRGVPHHLIDILDPEEAIDAASYAARADTAIAEVAARGKLPVIVGGTGLWLRALLRGLLQAPPVDRALRSQLEARFVADGPAAMHDALAAVDPLSADAIHANDMLRVVRALEFHAQTGRALGEARRQHALGAPRYRALTLALDLPDDRWRARLESRVDKMLAAGWIDEVRQLLARHGPSVRPLGAVGYRQVVEHLTAGTPRSECRTQILRATRLYGKRQRTWLRSEPGTDARIAPDAVLQPPMLTRIATHVGRVL